MAIDTNALTLGSSAPAKSSFQTRASGAGSNPVANDPSTDADPSSQSGASTPAGQNTGSNTPVQPGATTQKSAGPSAQTRTNARATRASKASAPAGAAPAAPATEAADTNSNFGSVMANALERSAATAADPEAPTAAAATTGTNTAATSSQPNAQAPADAMAWIAQVLTPPPTGAQPGTAPAAAQATAGAALVGSVTAASSATAAAMTTATAAQAAALPAGAAAAALRARSDEPPLAQAPNPQTTAVTAPAAEAAQATPSTTLDGLNAMADVQKLISGMTTANSGNADPGSDDNAADTPPTHATTASADGTQAAAALQASALTRSDAQGSATLTIQAPVGSAAFADEVSARVSGLAQSGITQAQLQLNPADLGPVQVHITMQAGQASVWFGANHADTRAALEQSLPRLRELFAGAGMPLSDSGVFREPPQQQQAQSLSNSGTARSSGSDAVSAPTVTQVSNIRLSLLDTYA